MTKAQKQPAGPEGAELSSWRGYTQYRCTACPFDTLDRETFEDHWIRRHGSLELHADAAPDFVETPPAAVGETFVQE